jgi:hypothetical protein
MSPLKKMVGPNVVVSAELPVDSVVLQFPEKILQKRLATRGVRSVQQGLIKWSSAPESLATWEDLEPLKQRSLLQLLGDNQCLRKGELLQSRLHRRIN